MTALTHGVFGRVISYITFLTYCFVATLLPLEASVAYTGHLSHQHGRVSHMVAARAQQGYYGNNNSASGFSPPPSDGSTYLVRQPQSGFSAPGQLYAASAASFPTKVYIAVGADSVESIAARYHVSPSVIRSLNQGQIASGRRLSPGDVIIVPQSPVVANSSGAPLSLGTSYAQAASGWLDQAAQILTSDDKKQSVQNLAIGSVSSYVNGNVANWLNRYGTANVNISLDDHFSLKNSSLQALFPLWDKGRRLVFVQGGVHRSGDGRLESNIGTGMRYFANTYMVGGNVFLDYDLSNRIGRLGAGVEYWRDFLRLNANGYYRLSNWSPLLKGGGDEANYLARAANGFDLRAEGYLPNFPQLGASLAYEQYFGQGVGLSGKENLRYNPYSVTVGLNYTPVPLVTLNANYQVSGAFNNKEQVADKATDQAASEAKNKNSSFNLGAQLTYRFGVPLFLQLDPHAVKSLRTMAGGRYDLVNRNNDIVLDYKKVVTIRLDIPQQLSGHSHESINLPVRVISPSPVKDLICRAPALEAAGGSFTKRPDLSGLTVILPAYNLSSQNIYPLEVQAADGKGNISKVATTHITVLPNGNSDKVTGTFTPPCQTIFLKDNKGRPAVFYLALTDASGSAVKVDVDKLKVRVEETPRGTPSAVVDGFKIADNGQYELDVHPGTTAEHLALTPYLADKSVANLLQVGTAQLSIVSGSDDDDFDKDKKVKVTFTSDSQGGKIKADGKASVSLFLTLKRDDVALTGEVANISFDVKLDGKDVAKDQIKISNIVEDPLGSGRYVGHLTTSRTGKITLVPRFKKSVFTEDQLSLDAYLGKGDFVPDVEKSTLVLEPNKQQIFGDGKTVVRLSYTLRDKRGNLCTERLDASDVAIKEIVTKSPKGHDDSPEAAADGEGKALPLDFADGVYTYSAAYKIGDAGRHIFVPYLKNQALEDKKCSLDVRGLDDKSSLDIVDDPDGALSDKISSGFVKYLSFHPHDYLGWNFRGLDVADAVSFKVYKEQEGTEESSSARIVLPLIWSEKRNAYLVKLYGLLPGTYWVDTWLKSENRALTKRVRVEFEDYDLKSHAEFSVTPSDLKADNVEKAVARLKIYDDKGRPLTGLKEDLSLYFSLKDSGEPIGFAGITTYGPMQETAPGIYTRAFSTNRTGTLYVMPRLNVHDLVKKPAEVHLRYSGDFVVDPSRISIKAEKPQIIANNQDRTVLDIYVEDKVGNLPPQPLSGSLRITEAKDSGQESTIVPQFDAARHIYTVSVKSAEIAAYTIKAYYDGGERASATIYARGVGSTSSLTANPSSVPDTKRVSSKIILQARDKFSAQSDIGVFKGFKPQDVQLRVFEENGSAAQTVSLTDLSWSEEDGAYVAKASCGKTGSYKIQAYFNGAPVTNVVTLIHFVSVDKEIAQISVKDPSIPADNATETQIILTVRSQDKKIPFQHLEKELSFVPAYAHGDALEFGDVTIGEVSETAPGVYQASIKSQRSGSLRIYLAYKQQMKYDVVASLVVVPVKGHKPSPANSKLMVKTSQEIIADKKEKATLQLLLLDDHKSAVPDFDVKAIKVDPVLANSTLQPGDAVVSDWQVGDAPGLYTASFTTKKPGKYSFNVQLGAEALPTQQAYVLARGIETASLKIVPNALVPGGKVPAKVSFVAKDSLGIYEKFVEKGLIKLVAHEGETPSSPITDKVVLGSLKWSAQDSAYVGTANSAQAGKYLLEVLFEDQPIPVKGAVALVSFANPVDENSSLSIAPATINANNKDSAALVLLAKAGNVGISGLKVSYEVELEKADGSLEKLDPSEYTVSAAQELTQGAYTSQFTTTRIGSLHIYACIDSGKGPQRLGQRCSGVLTTTAPDDQKIDPTKTSFEADPDSIFITNKPEAVLTLTAVDVNKNPVGSVAKKIVAKVKKQGSVTQDAQIIGFSESKLGVYTSPFKANAAGVYTFDVSVDGVAVNTDVKVTAINVVSDNISLELLPQQAGYAAGSHVEAHVMVKGPGNKSHNVGEDTLTLIGRGSDKKSDAPDLKIGKLIWSEKDGYYKGDLSSDTVKKYWVEVEFLGKPITPKAVGQFVDFIFPDGGSSSIKVAKDTIIADNKDNTMITLALKNGAVIFPGLTAKDLEFQVKLDGGNEALAAGDVTVSTIQESPEGSGIYVATISTVRTGVLQLQAKVFGEVLEGCVAELKAKAPDDQKPDPNRSKILINGKQMGQDIVADGTDSVELLLSLKDEHNNLITDAANINKINVTAHLGDQAVAVDGWRATKEGYIAKFKTDKIGRHSFTIKYDDVDLDTNGIYVAARGVGGNSFLTEPHGGATIADGKHSIELDLFAVDGMSPACKVLAEHGTLKFIAHPFGADGTTADVTFTTPVWSNEKSVYVTYASSKIVNNFTAELLFNNKKVGQSVTQLLAFVQPVADDFTVSVSPATIIADGAHQAALSLVVTHQGRPVTDLKDQISFEYQYKESPPVQEGDIIVGSVEEKTAGVYQALLSSNRAGLLYIYPVYKKARIKGKQCALTISLPSNKKPDPDKSTLTGDEEVIADNTHEAKLIYTAKEEHGRSLLGLDLNGFSLVTRFNDQSVEPIKPVSWSEEADGVYVATLRIKQGGKYSFTVNYKESPANSVPEILKARSAEYGSTLAADPQDVAPSSEQNIKLIFKPRDQFGVYKKFGDVVSLRGFLSDHKTAAPVGLHLGKMAWSEKDEAYIAKVGSEDVGRFAIEALFNNNSIATGVFTDITFSYPSSKNSILRIESSVIKANGVDGTEVTMTSTIEGRPLLGLEKDLSFAGRLHAGGDEEASLIIGAVRSDGKGNYSAVIKAHKVGLFDIYPVYKGQAISGLSIILETKPDDGKDTKPSSDKSYVSVVDGHADIVADGKDLTSLSLSLENQYGDALIGAADDIHAAIILDEKPMDKEVSHWVETSSGVYKADFTASSIGTYHFDIVVRGVKISKTVESKQVEIYGRGASDGSTLTAQSAAVLVGQTISLKFVPHDFRGAYKELNKNYNSLVLVAHKGEDFSAPSSDVKLSSLQWSETDKAYIATATSQVEGVYAIEALFLTKAIGSGHVFSKIAFTKPNKGNSSLRIDPASIFADGQQPAHIIFTSKQGLMGLEDGLDFEAEFKDTAGQIVTPPLIIIDKVKSEGKGVYSALIRANKVGVFNLYPRYEGKRITGMVSVLTTTPGKNNKPVQDKSKLRIEPVSDIVADNKTATTLKLELRNAFDDPVTGVASSLSACVLFNNKDSGDKLVKWEEDSAHQGLYTAPFTAKSIGTYSFTVSVRGVTLIFADVHVRGRGASEGSILTAQPRAVAPSKEAIIKLSFVPQDDFGLYEGLGDTIRLVAHPLDRSTISDDVVFDDKGLKWSAKDHAYITTAWCEHEGGYVVEALFLGKKIGAGGATTIVHFGGPEDGSAIDVNPKVIHANNSDLATMTFLAKAGGEQVCGLAKDLSFQAEDDKHHLLDSSVFSVKDIREDKPGVYLASLTTYHVGIIYLYPLYKNVRIKGHNKGGEYGDLNTTIEGLAPDDQKPDAAHSTVTLDPKEIVAAHAEQSKLTLVVKDSRDNAITGLEKEIAVEVKKDGAAVSNAKLSDWVAQEGSAGTYTSSVSVLEPGLYTFVVKARDVTLDTSKIELHGRGPEASSQIKAAPPVVVNSGNFAKIIFYPKDQWGVYEEKLTPYISLVGHLASAKDTKTEDVVLTSLAWSASAKAYVAHASSTHEGSYLIEALFAGKRIGSAGVMASLKFTQGVDYKSDLTVTPSQIVADGKESAHIALIVRDKDGLVLKGLTSALEFVGYSTPDDKIVPSSKITFSKVSEDAEGTYRATVASTFVGHLNIRVKYNGTLWSNKAPLEVKSLHKDVDRGLSTVSVDEREMRADSSEKRFITLLARDKANQPVAGLAGLLKTSLKLNGKVASAEVQKGLSAWKETGPGEYKATLTTKIVGVYTLALSASDTALDTHKVVVRAHGAQEGSSFVAHPDRVANSGHFVSNLIFIPVDMFGTYNKLAPALHLRATKDNSESKDLNFGPLTWSNETSSYMAQVSSDTPGTYQVEVLFAGREIGKEGLKTKITFVAPDAEKSSIEIAPASIIGDGEKQAVITFIAHGSSGEPISGLVEALKFKAELKDDILKEGYITFGKITDLGNGIYIADVTSSHAGTYSIYPLYKEKVFGDLSARLAVVASKEQKPSDTYSRLEVDHKEVVADGKDSVTIKFTAKDESNQPIIDLRSQLNLTLLLDKAPSTAVRLSEWHQREDGVYTISFSTYSLGRYDVALSTRGFTKKIADFIHARGADKDSILKIEPASILPTEGSFAKIFFIPHDEFGTCKRLAGLVLLAARKKGSDGATKAVTLSHLLWSPSDNAYIARASSTQLGTYEIEALFDGRSLSAEGVKATLTVEGPDQSQCALVKDKDSIKADFADAVTLTFTARSASGHVLAGLAKEIQFEVRGANEEKLDSDVVAVTSTEDIGAGKYKARIYTSHVGGIIAYPLYKGARVGSLRENVKTVEGNVPALSTIKLAVSARKIVADGRSVGIFTVTPQDGEGRLIAGLMKEIEIHVNGKPAAGSGVDFKSFSYTLRGYEAAFSSLHAASYKLSVKIKSLEKADDGQVLFLVPDGGSSHLSADPKTLPIGKRSVGHASAQLFAKLGSGETYVLSGIKDSVKFVAYSVGTFSEAKEVHFSETLGTDTYSAGVYSDKAGEYDIDVLFNGRSFGVTRQRVHFTGPENLPDGCDFSVSPPSIIADNTQKAKLSLSLSRAGEKVEDGAPHIGFEVVAENESHLYKPEVFIEPVQHVGKGEYVTSLYTNRVGTMMIYPTYDGVRLGNASGALTAIAQKDQKPSLLYSTASANRDDIIVDDRDRVYFTAVLLNQYRNPITGIANEIETKVTTQGRPSSQLKLSAWREIGPGIYRSVGTTDTMATYRLNVSCRGVALASRPIIINGRGANEKSMIVADPVAIMDTDAQPSRITVIPYDQLGICAHLADVLSVHVFAANGVEKTKDIIKSKLVWSASRSAYEAIASGNEAGDYIVELFFNGKKIGSKGVRAPLYIISVPDGQESSLEIAPQTIVANGLDAARLTLTLSAHKQLLTGLLKDISFKAVSKKDGTDVTPEVRFFNQEEVTTGLYRAAVSTTREGGITVYPYYRGKVIGDLNVFLDTLKSDNKIPTNKSSIDLQPSFIASNDEDAALLTFTARDDTGQIIEDLPNMLSVAVIDEATHKAGAVTVKAAFDLDKPVAGGVYKWHLTSARPGSYTVSVLYNHSAIVGVKSLALAVRGPSPEYSEFTVAPASIKGDGQAVANIRLLAKDKLGVITGMADKIQFIAMAVDKEGKEHEVEKRVVAFSKIVEQGNSGLYTATVSGSTVGLYHLHVVYGAKTVEGLTKDLTFESAVDGQSSRLSLSRGVLPLGGQAELVLWAKTAAGSPVIGLSGHLSVVQTSGQEKGLSFVDFQEDAQQKGMYIALITANAKGTYELSASLDGAPIKTLAGAPVLLKVKEGFDGESSTLSSNKEEVVAGGEDYAVVALLARSVEGRPYHDFDAQKLRFIITDAQGKAVDYSAFASKMGISTEYEGEYKGNVYFASSTEEGAYNVSMLYDGKKLEDVKPVTLKVLSSHYDPHQTSFELSKHKIKYHKKEATEAILRSYDKRGKPYSAFKLSDLKMHIFDTTGKEIMGGEVLLSAITEVSTGVYKQSIYMEKTGHYRATLFYQGKLINGIASQYFSAHGPNNAIFKIVPDILTVSTDKQNVDYGQFVLTACDDNGHPREDIDETLLTPIVYNSGRVKVTTDETIIHLLNKHFEKVKPGEFRLQFYVKKEGAYSAEVDYKGQKFPESLEEKFRVMSDRPSIVHFKGPSKLRINESGDLSLYIVNKAHQPYPNLSTENLSVRVMRSDYADGLDAVDVSDNHDMVSCTADPNVKGPGNYQLKLKILKHGYYTLTPTYMRVELPLDSGVEPLKIYVGNGEDNIDGAKSYLSADKDTVVSNNGDYANILLEARNKDGEAASDLDASQLTFHITDPDGSPVDYSEFASKMHIENLGMGAYRGHVLFSSVAKLGSYSVTMYYRGQPIENLNAVNLKVVQPFVVVNQTRFVVDKNVIRDHKSEKAIITIRTYDQSGTLYSGFTPSDLKAHVFNSEGQDITFNADKVELSSVENVAVGIYKQSVAMEDMGDYKLTIYVHNQRVNEIGYTPLKVGEQAHYNLEMVPEILGYSSLSAHNFGTLTLRCTDDSGRLIAALDVNKLSTLIRDSFAKDVTKDPSIVELAPHYEMPQPGVYTIRVAMKLVGRYTAETLYEGQPLSGLTSVRFAVVARYPIVTELKAPALSFTDKIVQVHIGIQDENHKPYANLAVNELGIHVMKSLSADGRDSVDVTKDSSTVIFEADEGIKGPGNYQVLARFLQPGFYTITPTYYTLLMELDPSVKPVVIEVKSGDIIDGGKSHFYTSDRVVLADAQDAATVNFKAIAKDNGLPATQIPTDLLTLRVVYAADNSVLDTSSVVAKMKFENTGNGLYVAHVLFPVGTKLGVYTVSVCFAGEAISALETIQLEAAAPAIDHDKLSFTVKPNKIAPNKKQEAHISLCVYNQKGQQTTIFDANRFSAHIFNESGEDITKDAEKVKLSAMHASKDCYEQTVALEYSGEYQVALYVDEKREDKVHSQPLSVTSGAAPVPTWLRAEPGNILTNQSTTLILTISDQDKAKLKEFNPRELRLTLSTIDGGHPLDPAQYTAGRFHESAKKEKGALIYTCHVAIRTSGCFSARVDYPLSEEFPIVNEAPLVVTDWQVPYLFELYAPKLLVTDSQGRVDFTLATKPEGGDGYPWLGTAQQLASLQVKYSPESKRPKKWKDVTNDRSYVEADNVNLQAQTFHHGDKGYGYGLFVLFHKPGYYSVYPTIGGTPVTLGNNVYIRPLLIKVIQDDKDRHKNNVTSVRIVPQIMGYANGQRGYILVDVYDKAGRPQTGLDPNAFSATIDSVAGPQASRDIKIDKFKETRPGEYTALVTVPDDDKFRGAASVSVTYDDDELPNATDIPFIIARNNLSVEAFSVNHTRVYVKDKVTATVAVLRDARGAEYNWYLADELSLKVTQLQSRESLVGKDITGNRSIVSVTRRRRGDNPAGHYTLDFMFRKPGCYLITPTYFGENMTLAKGVESQFVTVDDFGLKADVKR